MIETTPEPLDKATHVGGIAGLESGASCEGRMLALESLWHDVRFAGRSLRKNPGFATIVLATFAIGIGANASIFAAANAVLLRPLPYPDEDSLVMVWSTNLRAGETKVPMSVPNFADFEGRSRSFAALAGSTDAVYTLTDDGPPEMIIGYQLSPAMFSVLGVRPELGRSFDASDGEDVVVLSDQLWRRRFHADSSIIGRSIRLAEGKRHVVLGVMPPGVQYPQSVELWTPLVIPDQYRTSRSRGFVRIVGRLKPGVTLEAARREVRGIAASLAREYPDANENRGADVDSMRAEESGDVRPIVLILLGAVGFVLLLACTNIAGLTLARATGRRREIALRVALGAGRGRVIRQLVTESLFLALVGGAAGFLLAIWGTRLLVAFFPKDVSNLAIPRVEHIPLDGTVVLFSMGAAIVAGLVSGLLPALHASRSDLNEVLKEGGRSLSPAARLRPALVVVQVVLAMVLATCAGLLLASSVLRERSLGFDSSHVLTGRLLLDPKRYPDEARMRQVYLDVADRLRAVPGVTAVGGAAFLPMSGWSADVSFRAVGQSDVKTAGVQIVDSSYFSTLHIPIVRGRNFGPEDRVGAPGVILVDERFVEKFAGGADPIGMRSDFGKDGVPDWREVVGVVANIDHEPPPIPQDPTVYRPVGQFAWNMWGFVVRTAGDPNAAAGALREVVGAVDPMQPVSYVRALDGVITDAMAAQRVSTALVSFFAILALALAATGVYGVLAQTVLERQHEIGIRMALGAPRRHVIGIILGRLAVMAGLGIVLGIPAALAAGRLLAALLYGVSGSDPRLLAGVSILLAAVTVVAALVPILRALRTDPLVALRAE